MTATTEATTTATATTAELSQRTGGVNVWPTTPLALLLGAGSSGYYARHGGCLDVSPGPERSGRE